MEVGDRAPDFTLMDENNEPVTLSQLRGENVVLVFYPLDFSPTCTRELQDIAGLQTKFDAAGAHVFGISVDSRYCHAAFKRDQNLSARLLADFHPHGEVGKAYGVYLEDRGFNTRGTFVIDREGIIRYQVVNQPGEARNQEEALQALELCPA